MPIVRYYDDPAALLGLAHQSGLASGRADARARQQQRDHEFIMQQQASRNRMNEMRTAYNLDGSQSRGGGSPGPQSGGVQTFLSDAASRKPTRAEESQFELDAIMAQRGELLGALETQYAGKQKDLSYFVARDTIKSGKELDDRILNNLGIKSGSEKMAEEREKRLRDGEADTGAPKTAQERVFRQTLDQGRAGDLLEVLAEREKPNAYGETGALTSNALSARAQLQSFVEEANDPGTLKELKASLSKSDDPAIKSMVDTRIKELEQERVEVQAPAAYEQVLETFSSHITNVQRKSGAVPSLTDQRAALSKIIETTAKSYGMDVATFREWYRANQSAQRAAEIAANVPGAAPNEQPAMRPPPGTTPAPGLQGTRPGPEWMQTGADTPGGGFVEGIGPQPSR